MSPEKESHKACFQHALFQQGQRNPAGKLPHSVRVYIKNIRYFLFYSYKADKKERKKKTNLSNSYTPRKGPFFLS